MSSPAGGFRDFLRSQRLGGPSLVVAGAMALGLWGYHWLLEIYIPLAVHAQTFAIATAEGVAALEGVAFSALLLWIVWRVSEAPWPRYLSVVTASVLVISAVHAVLNWAGNRVIMARMAPVLPRYPPFEVMVYMGLEHLWPYGLFVTVTGLLLSRSTLVERELQLVGARASASEARLAALRFQLNPHFLFNTLNAISTLILERRPEQAEEVTERLSEFLRSSLRNNPGDQVPLETELAAVCAYLEIERVRFGDRIAFVQDIPAALGDVLVPTLILQPLVENAVKYAVAPSRKPVTVRIVARLHDEDLELSVLDEGAAPAPGAARARPGTGVGLQNTRDRLSALYGLRGRLETAAGPTGFHAVLRFPAARASRREAA
jgi:sensor histidine kinase YesM